jgi:hypothetical protein
MIYDDQGNELADIPLSERNVGILQADGAQITVLYHTPRMLQGTLGTRNGSFTLRRVGAQLVADNPAAVREYAGMQGAITDLHRRVLPEQGDD